MEQNTPTATTTPATTTTTTLPRAGSKQKLRLACDACLNAKVRCDKQHPSCQRCALSRRPCIYSPSRKSGRPAAARKRTLLAGGDGANASNTPAAISPRQTSPDRKSDPAQQQHFVPQQQAKRTHASSFNTVNASKLGSNANSNPLSTTSPPSSSSSSSGHDSGIFLMEEWLDFNTSSSSQDFDSSQQEHHLNNHQHAQHAHTEDASCSWLNVGKALENPNADDFASYADPSTLSPTFGGSGSPYSNSTGTEGLTSHVDMASDMFASNELASQLAGSHFDPMEGIQSPLMSDQQQRHDCDQQAFGILASLQMLHQQQLGSFSLDKVLDTNRTAINKLIELLDCSCALEPHLALEYAAIVPKILHWYKTAAKHLQPSFAASGSTATSPAPTEARQCPVLPQLGPISMSLGSFTLDESEQLDLTCRLVLSEVKKVEKIIAKMARVSVNGSTTLANKEEPTALEASAPSRYAFACVTLRAELQATIRQVGKGRKEITAIME